MEDGDAFDADTMNDLEQPRGGGIHRHSTLQARAAARSDRAALHLREEERALYALVRQRAR